MNFKSFLIEQAMYKPSDVTSKLAALDSNHENPSDSVLFGLKDSSGNVVEVRVAADQSEDFENALGRALNDLDDPEQPEIAEVLFSMHDKFTIIDVKWPQVIEDEEEDATDGGDIGDPMGDESGEMGDDPMGDESGEMGDDPMGGSSMDSDTTGVLDSVIQMMTADAEAKRQEAVARSAEARAREAEVSAKIANDKLSAEEEVADMEAHYQVQQDEQKEAKKLAKLAKYRHELKAQDDDQEADDYAGALSAQQDDSSTGVDTASRDSVDAALPNGSTDEDPNASLDKELDSVENEERAAGTNPQFHQLAALIKYLQSAKVNNTQND